MPRFDTPIIDLFLFQKIFVILRSSRRLMVAEWDRYRYRDPCVLVVRTRAAPPPHHCLQTARPCVTSDAETGFPRISRWLRPQGFDN
jgi:hypothetical protein